MTPSSDDTPHDDGDFVTVLEQPVWWFDDLDTSLSLSLTVLFKEDPADAIAVPGAHDPAFGLTLAAVSVLPRGDTDSDAKSVLMPSPTPHIFVMQAPADSLTPLPDALTSTATYTATEYFAGVAARAGVQADQEKEYGEDHTTRVAASSSSSSTNSTVTRSRRHLRAPP